MGTSTLIPRKYIPALCYFSAGLILEWDERKNEAKQMYQDGEQRILQAQSADDEQLNSKKIERVGIM